MIPVLVKLWEDNYSVYGARKLAKAARRAGHDIGRDQVARLMKAAGIAGVHRRRKVRTTKADPEAPRCHLPRGWDHRLASNYGPPIWLIGDDRRSSAGCQLRAFGGVGRTGLR
ncbi:hypothetical protein MALGJ_23130 [Mycolicibacter algericus]|nr:hypothetical protein MALGJ_23130 [Mycolicibacter algericus]